MRYQPSLTALACLLLIIAAGIVDVTVINPAYTTALATYKNLKTHYNEAALQQRRPLSDDQRAIAARLATPNDAKLLIGDMTQASTAAQLGNIRYSIGPFTPDAAMMTRRVELTFTASTDSAVWPFLQTIEDNSKPMLRLTALHITRADDAVQVNAVFTHYRWAE